MERCITYSLEKLWLWKQRRHERVRDFVSLICYSFYSVVFRRRTKSCFLTLYNFNTLHTCVSVSGILYDFSDVHHKFSSKWASCMKALSSIRTEFHSLWTELMTFRHFELKLWLPLTLDWTYGFYLFRAELVAFTHFGLNWCLSLTFNWTYGFHSLWTKLIAFTHFELNLWLSLTLSWTYDFRRGSVVVESLFIIAPTYLMAIAGSFLALQSFRWGRDG